MALVSSPATTQFCNTLIQAQHVEIEIIVWTNRASALATLAVNLALALESAAVQEAIRSMDRLPNELVECPVPIPDGNFPTPYQMIHYDEYDLMYDNRNRIPVYTLETLTPESLRGGAHRTDRFHEDEFVHPLFRSSSWDYRGTKWERGHLANAANHRKTQKAMDQTFTLANMAPQCRKLNRRNWKLAEMFTRRKAEKAARVVVVSGPAFRATGPPGQRKVEYIVIGDDDVAVPPEFFKAIAVFYDDDFGNEEAHFYGWIMENDSIPDAPLESFQCSLAEIQLASGLASLFKGVRFSYENGVPV